ncbi:MAG: hypothetical protein FWF85_10665, partial [Clostridiales bacterium]|nr:hypothetical protein [Clostridiales bacterium]
MRKTKPLLPLMASLAFVVLISLLSFSAVFAAEPNGLAEMPDPIDPQSWTLLRDTNWNNYVPNPVINWMDELNPESLVNPQGRGKNKISGAVILVDFWDKPFLMLGEKGADMFGWHAFKGNDTYQDYLDRIERGDPVTKNPQRVVSSEAELLKFWEDYLNKKLTDPSLNTHNYGVNIDEFWRENSYGKWGVDLDAFGVFHLQGFEMEYWDSVSNSSWNDIPPTFRRGASGTSGQRNFTSECISLATANGVYLGDYDFFFICHAGYDQSAIWMEFGLVQWKNGVDVPYEYGVRAKMEEVEKIFTAHPEYLLSLDARGGYNQSTTIRDEAAKVRAHQVLGTLADYEFKFPAAEWTWANNYIGQGSSSSLYGTPGGPNTGPTRYVKWTSWAAMATRWAGAGSASVPRSPANGGGSVSRRYSQQGESNGMATYAHEFGHIVGLSDNYSNSYGATYSPDSEPWDLMARGCFAGPFGDHARWSVPGGLEADSAPVHLMMLSKKLSNFYDPGDVFAFSVANLKTGGPVVANVVARNVPLNNNKTAANPEGYYPWLEEYGLVSPNYYKAMELTFDSANPDLATLRTTGFTWTRIRAGRMSVEVVQRTGYDSFAPDDGVVISRLATGTGQAHTVIDSHLYDLDMVDYYVYGDPVKYTMGNQAQLFDGAFKAGKSEIDTGYYTGGEFKGDKRGSEDVISGKTVNEFHDTANKLHFYILKNDLNPGKYGEFLSYQVGVLHEDGKPVGGDLVVKAGKFEAADPGRVATQWFTVTNTGDATDIIRVGADCALDFTLLNDLYAIEAGQTIEIPVYVGIPATDPAFKPLTFTASSESNAAKAGSVSVTDFSANIYAPAQIYVKEGNKVDYVVSVVNVANEGANLFTIEAAFDAKNLNYLGYTFGPSLLTHSPAQGSFSYDVVNGKLALDMHLGRPGVLIKAETETPLVTFHFTLKDGVAAGPDATVLDTFLSKVTGYCFIVGKSSPIDAIITKPGAPTKVLIHPLGYEGGELDEA